MDIRCKVCTKLDRCDKDLKSLVCSDFRIDLNRLIETADSVATEHNIYTRNALSAIDICLRYGGVIDD